MTHVHKVAGFKFTLFGALVAWMSVMAVSRAEAPKYFVKHDTWAATMLATRAAYAQRPQQEPLELATWFGTGPHAAKDFNEALFPEQGVDLAAKDEGGKPRWQDIPMDGRRRARLAGRGFVLNVSLPRGSLFRGYVA